MLNTCIKVLFEQLKYTHYTSTICDNNCNLSLQSVTRRRDVSLRLHSTCHVAVFGDMQGARGLTQSASRCDRRLCTYSVPVYKRCPYKPRGRYAYTAGIRIMRSKTTRAMHLPRDIGAYTNRATIFTAVRREEQGRQEEENRRRVSPALGAPCKGRKAEKDSIANKESVKRDADAKR